MCNTAIIFVLLCGISYGFVLTSSTNADFVENQFLQPGKAWVYEYSTQTTLNEKEDGKNHVGFIFKSVVVVESVWSSNEFGRVLKFSVSSPKVLTKSKKNNEYITQSSNMETWRNENFYVLWKKGIVERFLIRKEEELPLVNLKKGIVSLFQLQFNQQNLKEQDTSGICDVTYKLSKQKVEKIKSNCENFDLSYVSNIEEILSTKVDSFRFTSIEISSNKQYIDNVRSEENHDVYLSAKEEIGAKIRVEQVLKLTESRDCKNCIMNENNYEDVKQKIIDSFGVFKEETLLTTKDFSKKSDDKSFSNVVGENRDNLKTRNLGKLASAKAIIPLINSARKSNKEDILKVLNNKKNQKILPQLYDILGYVQTENAHGAVMKKLHFDDAKNEDNNERYLWACQLSSNPNPAIIIDLLNKHKKTENIPKKIQETLILSISAMASKLSNLNKLGYSKVVGIIRELLINNLDSENKEERVVYLRALRNLRYPPTIPKLIEVITNKEVSAKEEVLAWKALRAMNPKSWDEKVLTTAHKTYFQLDKTHDSSSRTLSADILLQSNPNDETLTALLNYLLTKDKEFEVKKYLWQQIQMMSEESTSFKDRVMRIIRNSHKLNNYSGISPRGLSLSLSRKFLDSQTTNGSLLTMQEMSNGIVKRGIVNVMMNKYDDIQELFSLGIFSGGLGSFFSSDSSEHEEVSTAGMELAILGTQLRPFVFFEGNGELMSHVWSGTASERTTAFQSLILIQDHQEFLRLGPGFIVDIDCKGSGSFDLAGKIEISLWNRNAQALIEKTLGYVGIVTINLDTSFIDLGVEYKINLEPSLTLSSDIDFSSNVALCMRLSQPESKLWHYVYKKETLPNGKSTLKKKTKTVLVPGKTYALNKKNDVMCSNMFNT